MSKNNQETKLYNDLVQYPWTHTAVVRLPDTVPIGDLEAAYSTIQQQLLRPLSRYHHARMAAIGIATWHKDPPHIHALLVSDRPSALATLDEQSLTTALFRDRSPLASKPGAILVQPINVTDGAIRYLVDHLPSYPRPGGIIYAGKKTLDAARGTAATSAPAPPTRQRTTPSRYRSRLRNTRTGAVLAARLVMDSAQLHGQPDLRAGDILSDPATGRRYRIDSTPRRSAGWGDDRIYTHVTLSPIT